jgi:flagellar basal-body rod modification protein FlgD
MATTSGVGATQTTSKTTTDPANDAFNGLDTNSFLKLMIAQLQNQDPLNPADNNQLLQQVNEIRNIGATDKLTSTLDSVLLGQNVTSATALIGKQIDALSDDNKKISGVVDRVTITDGTPKLHVGDSVVSLNNISDIEPSSTGS